MVFSLAMLASCAAKPIMWNHSSRGQVEFSRDNQKCLYEAEKYGHVAMYGTGVGAGLEEGMRKKKIYKMCMESIGYYVIAHVDK